MKRGLREIIKESQRSLEQMIYAYFIDSIEKCEEFLREILEDDEIEVVDIHGFCPRIIAKGYNGKGYPFAASIMAMEGTLNPHLISYLDTTTLYSVFKERCCDDVIPVYLITITEDDPYHCDSAIYHADTVIQEREIPFENGIHKILLNLEGNKPDYLYDTMQTLLEECVTENMYLPPL